MRIGILSGVSRRLCGAFAFANRKLDDDHWAVVHRVGTTLQTEENQPRCPNHLSTTPYFALLAAGVSGAY